MGSSAGAGSGEFHVYRHLRRKEYARQKSIQQKCLTESLDQEYRDKIENNRLLSEAKTAKKRAKRQKRKQKMRGKGKKPKTNSDDDNKSDEESEDDDSDKDDTEETKTSDDVESKEIIKDDDAKSDLKDTLPPPKSDNESNENSNPPVKETESDDI